MSVTIAPFEPVMTDAVIALSLRAWAPVFPQMQAAVQDYVYEAFYPAGWQVRQAADIAAFLEASGEDVWIAQAGREIAGFVGVRLHEEDRMGEVYILGVDPAHQRQGIAAALMQAAFARMQNAGMAMVMVETGDDPGHAPSRAAYERAGFTRWPVARYFRKL